MSNKKIFSRKSIYKGFRLFLSILSIFSITFLNGIWGIYQEAFIPKEVHAEVVNYGWTRTFGGTSSDQGNGISVDNSGNVYVTGRFQGTANFDDTGGTDNKTSNGVSDIFITKYNSDGSYGWTRTFGGTSSDSGLDISVDSSGNVYATGTFQGTVNFDDTGGTDNKTSKGSNDIFITKYNSDGSYGWTRTFGGNDSDFGAGISVDSNGNIYVTGGFRGIVNFNDSGGIDNRTSNGYIDGFLTKYNSDGSYGWTKTFGGNAFDDGSDIGLDSSGNIYIVGRFQNTVNFNSSDGIDNKTSNGDNDIFITKYHSDGNYGWTRTFGSSQMDLGFSISVDSNSNVYTTGYFNGAVNFDDTGGIDNKTPNGSTDIFITKYNSDGSYGWTRTFGGSIWDEGFGISVDSSGNVYVTGYFRYTVNFDSTGGIDNKTSKNGEDIFITKYNSDGSYGWTKTFEGNASNRGLGISVDSKSNVYATGYFAATADFDGSGGTDNKTSNGNNDIFITKYTNLYQIANLDEALDVTNSSGEGITTSNGDGVNGTVELYLRDSLGNIISVVEADMTTDRDWSGVAGSIDLVNGKSVVNGLTSAPGTASTHTLYIPTPSIGESKVVRICPDATDMNGVTKDCSNGVNFMEGQTKTVGSDSVTVTKSTVGGRQYWLADGVSGTGGMSLFSSFNLKDTLSRLEVNTSSNHTIEFGSINGLETNGDTIELTFDLDTQAWDLSTITVSDIELDADGSPLTLAATPGVDIWGVSINTGTDTITFTAPTSGTSYIESGTPLVVRIGDHTTSGTNQIDNPTTVGEYEVSITNTYSAGGGGVETGEVEIPIIDDDTVNVHGYIDTLMTFDIDTAITDTDCDAVGGTTPCNSHGSATDSAGYVVSLGELTLESVNKSGDSVLHADGSTGLINYIYFNLETNANSGAVVTVFSENGGLLKDASNIIPSVDMGGARLLEAGSGRYGLNHRAGFINSASIGSILVDGYCNASDTQYCSPGTGASLPLTVFSTSGPLSEGRVQFSVGASPTGTTATGTYTDQLRFIATASF